MTTAEKAIPAEDAYPSCPPRARDWRSWAYWDDGEARYYWDDIPVSRAEYLPAVGSGAIIIVRMQSMGIQEPYDHDVG
jgi:hypothetical protein